jgi:DNA (cytosine-5)-methyltransferase 1
LFFNIQEIIHTKIKANKKDKSVKIPRVILLENVKGFRNHDKGNTFKTIKTILNKLGYEVAEEVLNSKYFGVPQNRERLFIVAWHKKQVKKNSFNFPHGLDEKGHVIYKKSEREELAKKITVGKILFKNGQLAKHEELADKEYTISEKLWAGHQRRKEQHLSKGNGFGFSLFNAKSPYTSTISARYYKDGSEILISQNTKEGRPDRPRKLHPIEAARLQGYPIDEWYKIPVSDNQAYKQFGNSVSVPVVTTIAKEIVEQLLTSK